jgi:NADPH:quinone reductase-like Zn-dependent oxidoreductase
VLFGIAGAVKPGGKRDLANVAGLSLLLAFSKLWRKPAVVLHAIDQLVKTQRREINDDIRTVVGLLARGAINPRIGAVLPLAEAQRAHQLMESRENVGKIVLVP